MIGKNKLKRNTAKRYSFLLAERIKGTISQKEERTVELRKAG